MQQVKVLYKKYLLDRSVILLLFSTLLAMSCQKELLKQKELNNSDMEINKDSIKDILRRQIIAGAAEEYGSYENYNKSDLSALIDIEKNLLEQHNFKILDNNDFKIKIQDIFARKIDFNSTLENLKIDNNDICNRELLYKVYSADNQYFYISKKFNFITNFYPLPLMIDYKRLFPDLVDLENTPIEINVEGDEINAKRWKDIEDLEKQRNHNIQTLISRNKYLFNDSKADFAWLKFNDKIFLESLVKTFGYVKDKELLAFVLENNYKEKEELEKIVWNKKCGGEIVVNKEVFDLAKSWKKEKRHDFLMYMLFVVENRKKEFDSNTELTFSQKAKVLGLLSYYSTEIGNIDDTYAYSFFPMLSGKNYDDEFKRNNYYNIPDFKAVYEDARTGGIDIDNWVQPGLTSTQTKNPNTETLITIYDRADFNSFSQEITTKNEIEYIYVGSTFRCNF